LSKIEALQYGLIFALVPAVLIGLTLLSIRLWASLNPLFVALLIMIGSLSFIWLIFLLSSVLLLNLDNFVKHFLLRFFLSLRGELPWYLTSFLDEAAKRLLLKKVGRNYIFVHRLLRDYLALQELPIS
jgi:hypothetical protein